MTTSPLAELGDIPELADKARIKAAYELTLASWPKEMMWRPAKISRYDNNPRQNLGAVVDVIRSLLDFGARQPIVVDEGGVILVGDTRYLALLALGWPKYPIHVARGLSPEKARAYRIADNKIGERAEWDYERLKLEFDTLADLGLDLTETGWRDFEIEPIREADWSPRLPEHVSFDANEGEEQPLIEFDADQWPTIQKAIGKMRRQERNNKKTGAEVLTRLASIYLSGK
jgi:hypothetical protein